MSSLTHLIGFFLSIAGLVLMVVVSAIHGTSWHVVSFSIFGASLILLYLASTVYHFLSKDHKHKNAFMRVDLSFIFILIAGTYTPIALVPIRGPWGWSIFGVVWGMAVLGVVTQIFKINLKPWVHILMYLIMGWLIVIVLPSLIKIFDLSGIIWLVSGGLAYTIGVVFFVIDKIFPKDRLFGLHEVFHVFVMIGSFCHFWLMYNYIVYI